MASSCGVLDDVKDTPTRGTTADGEWTEAEMRVVYNVLLPIGTTVPW
jgi:hypothetical protein